MRIIIISPFRLFGESLAACLDGSNEVSLAGIVEDFGALRRSFGETPADLVLVDITAGFNLEEIRALAAERPDLILLAVGLKEQRQEVVRCGSAGFAGYVARDASLGVLRQAIADAAAGRLTCPAEISGGLMRALFRRHPAPAPLDEDALTRREGDVLRLLGHGLSNKEIAGELDLSVATVKHHVHHILSKLGLARRSQAMRCIREAPWIG